MTVDIQVVLNCKLQKRKR